eukprot:5317052-Amphidinium_carterae.1
MLTISTATRSMACRDTNVLQKRQNFPPPKCGGRPSELWVYEQRIYDALYNKDFSIVEALKSRRGIA